MSNTALLKKLMKIQHELKAPKSQYNDFGKYNYRNCEDILEAVKPLLFANGCALIINDAVVMIGERYYVRAEATIYDTDDGLCITNIAFAREEECKKGMDGSQITGASSSYARKYALDGLFAIDDTKDADSLSSQNPQKPQYQCEECGLPFKTVKTSSGTYTAKEIYNKSKAANGRALCKACLDKEAENAK